MPHYFKCVVRGCPSIGRCINGGDMVIIREHDHTVQTTIPLNSSTPQNISLPQPSDGGKVVINFHLDGQTASNGPEITYWSEPNPADREREELVRRRRQAAEETANLRSRVLALARERSISSSGVNRMIHAHRLRNDSPYERAVVPLRSSNRQNTRSSPESSVVFIDSDSDNSEMEESTPGSPVQGSDSSESSEVANDSDDSSMDFELPPPNTRPRRNEARKSAAKKEDSKPCSEVPAAIPLYSEENPAPSPHGFCMVCHSTTFEQKFLIIPCGHSWVCDQCKSGKLKMCPFCRGPVNKFVRILETSF